MGIDRGEGELLRSSIASPDGTPVGCPVRGLKIEILCVLLVGGQNAVKLARRIGAHPSVESQAANCLGQIPRSHCAFFGFLPARPAPASSAPTFAARQLGKKDGIAGFCSVVMRPAGVQMPHGAHVANANALLTIL